LQSSPALWLQNQYFFSVPKECVVQKILLLSTSLLDEREKRQRLFDSLMTAFAEKIELEDDDHLCIQPSARRYVYIVYATSHAHCSLCNIPTCFCYSPSFIFAWSVTVGDDFETTSNITIQVNYEDVGNENILTV
jgi:hypothetical protein